MRSKAPLALMEQMIMALVFALAAALCLQGFALADKVSARNAAVDRAVIVCQNAAETLKSVGGEICQATLSVCYDEDWNVLREESGCAYRLLVRGQPSPVAGLCSASIRVCREESGEELFSLTAAWQEVKSDGC